VPNAATIGVLLDPTFSSFGMQVSEVQAAARATAHELRLLNVSSDADIDEAFSILVKIRAGGLVVGGNPFLNGRRTKLIALAAREAIPTIYETRESTIAGGLMNYGASITDVYRQAGVYTGRILKGEKPADLPVLQPAKFDLLINLKTAKALGLEVPPSLLARADEVIE
jgi:putative ABC transport system substrate-binding protein